MNIASLLMAVPEPDRPALIFPSLEKSVITFRQLDDFSSRLADGFYRKGLRQNDRVVMLAPVSLNLYASLIALFRLGVTAIFLDPQTGYKQLDRTMSLVRANALICSHKALWLRWVSPALRQVSHIFLSEGNSPRSLTHMANSSIPCGTIAEVDEETPALITFTGGGTDSLGPRGVIRTHRLLTAQYMALKRALPIKNTDIDLPAFPVATLHNLASGVTSVIPNFPLRRPDAVQPEKVLQQIETFGITTASGPPAYWSVITNYCLEYKQSLPLRRIVTGGAPISPLLIRGLRQVAPDAGIVNVYGSTEAEPVAWISGREFMDETTKPKSAGSGIPLGGTVPEVRVRIQGVNGEEQGAGHVGEIWVSGEHVARHYFANPHTELKNKFLDADGILWHCMGDLGYVDGAGRLWLAGRVNTVVMREGSPIYPVPIEMLIETLPFVRRAALIGFPDPRLGERSVLIVEFVTNIVKSDGWRSQLRLLCAEHGLVVDEVRSIRRMPVDARHNSRIDYRRLKAKMIR